MTDTLERSALSRWRQEPIAFIEEVIRNPETGRPFELLEAQRKFFAHAWQMDETGRLVYAEQIYASPKKSGKTLTAAQHLITTTLVFGGRFAEGYAVANDLEQAQGRVFQAARRICEASPLLKRDVLAKQSRLEFPETGASITAIASDYAGAAGGHPTISSFDELWGFTSERSRRLWDEMVPVPTRKVSARLTTTYGGFSSESELLEELYQRGLAQPTIGDNLRGGDGLLMFWSHERIAPWQTDAWLEQMRRSLRPNQYARMIETRFVTSEGDFVSASEWDSCVDLTYHRQYSDRSLSIYVGVDASTKRDSTAIVAVTFNRQTQEVRLVTHRIFQPSADQPLNFEHTVEATIRDLSRRFRVRNVLFDPYQMMSSAQRLAAAGIPINEFAQSTPNLTAASQNLYDLIAARKLVLYPDTAMRLALTRTVALESSRGWRIAKEKASHKIDVIVALAMAAYAAVQSAGEYGYSLDAFQPGFVDLDKRGDPHVETGADRQWQHEQLYWAIMSGALDR